MATNPKQEKRQGSDNTSATVSDTKADSSSATTPTTAIYVLTTENTLLTRNLSEAFAKTAQDTRQLLETFGKAAQNTGTLLAVFGKNVGDTREMVNGKQDEQITKIADAIKRNGENFSVVVSSSIEKALDQLQKNGPALKRSFQKNGKEVIVVLDAGLKHPLVITGISTLAKTQGILYPEIILTGASLAVSQILARLPEYKEPADMASVDGCVDEIDASELMETASKDANAGAEVVGNQPRLLAKL